MEATINSQESASATSARKFKVIFWVSTVIIVLWEGVMPLSMLLFAPEQATVGTQPLGYPNYFAYALIFCKVLGVTAIAYSKTPETLREWAYAGLTFNLIFAFISHACVDQNVAFMLMPLVFLGILLTSYAYHRKIHRR